MGCIIEQVALVSQANVVTLTSYVSLGLLELYVCIAYREEECLY